MSIFRHTPFYEVAVLFSLTNVKPFEVSLHRHL